MTRCAYCAVTTLAEVGLCDRCGAPLPDFQRGPLYFVKRDAVPTDFGRCKPGSVFVVDNPEYVVAHQYQHKV